MNVRYVGPALDYSGYGEACRHDIGALHEAGVGLTLEIPKHTLEIADFGELGKLCIGLQNKSLDYKVTILHTTPNIYQKYLNPNDYNIGRVFWETDKLPPDFAYGVKMVQEIWTGSEFNAQAIRNAGITDIPIFIIPEAIKAPEGDINKFDVPNKADYCFYSIFEWTERKNPRALLEAFWREFEGEDDVSLTLKVFIDSFRPDKRRELHDRFKQCKRSLNLEKCAPVYLATRLMNRSGIYRLHETFDCLVSAHRGEGWGIPQMEAMLLGNPVISTDCGGIHEYIGDVAKLVPCEMIPVRNVDKNGIWYLPDQNWAEVDVSELRKAMRWCYDNRERAKDMGSRASKLVNKLFSFDAVGRKMKDRLIAINA